MHTIKPIDREAVVAAARETGAIVTAENHYTETGLGAAVSEAVVQNYPVPVEIVGMPDTFGEVGQLEYLKKKFGMTAEDIATAAEKAIRRKQK